MSSIDVSFDKEFYSIDDNVRIKIITKGLINPTIDLIKYNNITLPLNNSDRHNIYLTLNSSILTSDVKKSKLTIKYRMEDQYHSFGPFLIQNHNVPVFE